MEFWDKTWKKLIIAALDWSKMTLLIIRTQFSMFLLPKSFIFKSFGGKSGHFRSIRG